jgi:peptidoglycan/LPS O-acetylase OafA/YrhL
VAVLLILTVVLCPAMRWSVGSPFAAYVLTYCRLDGLACGILCALALRSKTVRWWLGAHQALLYLGTTLLPLGVLLNSIAHTSNWSVFSYSCYSLAYAAFLLLALTQPIGVVAHLTALRPLRTLGILAYGLYLFHYSLHGLAHVLFFNRPPRLDSLAASMVTLGTIGATFALLTALLAKLECGLPLIFAEGF